MALGSSNSEVFDYLFGDNPDYHPFWASGWSARGLRSPASGRYLKQILDPIPRDANVILNFGFTDVAANFRFMAVEKGVFDFATSVVEAVTGLATARRRIARMGFARITASFLAPHVPLPQSYWEQSGPGCQLPDRMVGNAYRAIFEKTAKKMPTVDLFDELSQGPSGAHLLRDAFARSTPDHHADYTKVQDLLWDKLAGLPGILPRRSPPHRALYPHVTAGINVLMKTGTTRPRTCI